MNRKKKLLIYQSFLLLIGISVVIITFQYKNDFDEGKIIPKSLEKKINKEINLNNDGNNKFFNVEYSGLDLQGNRFKIISKEAINSNENLNLVEMKGVKANFYFKDNTVLNISSDEAKYNNESLDIEFKKNVEANYLNSKLYAGNAKFLNSKNSLVISDKVRVIDAKGTMFADKLKFDIKKKTLDISSLKNNKVKSKLIYK